MEPLFVLLGAFLISLLILKVIKKKWMLALAGRMAMSIMLVFTGVAHFIYPEGMVLMLPDFIPFKTEMIYLTGVVEIAGAIGLLIPKIQKLSSWLLIVFFILILPANIHAAIKHVSLKTADFSGSGTEYLWFRIPLQVLFIAWVYYFGIRKGVA